MSIAEEADDLEAQTFTVLHDGVIKTVAQYVTVEGEVIEVSECQDINVQPTAEELADPGKAILKLVVHELLVRLKNKPWEFKAADFEMVRKLSSDNSVTLAQVRSGDFGSMAQRAAEEFPFPHAGAPN